MQCIMQERDCSPFSLIKAGGLLLVLLWDAGEVHSLELWLLDFSWRIRWSRSSEEVKDTLFEGKLRYAIKCQQKHRREWNVSKYILTSLEFSQSLFGNMTVSERSQLLLDLLLGKVYTLHLLSTKQTNQILAKMCTILVKTSHFLKRNHIFAKLKQIWNRATYTVLK